MSGKADKTSLPVASWGNITLNASVLTQATAQYQKYGNICITGIQGYVNAPNEWTDYKLGSGLPKAKYGFAPSGVFQTQDNQKAYAAYVGQDGGLYIRSENAPINGWMRGQVTYICQ